MQFTQKRLDYISKEELYIDMAKLVAKRSKDPNCQVGAVIVSSDDRILSVGYNGLPNGCSDDEFPWIKDAASELDTKYPYVCHAELNAILNFKGDSRELKGSTLYVTIYPCNECAKAIIQAGISKVVYIKNGQPDSVANIASTKLLEAAGVEIQKYEYAYNKTANVIDKIYILQNSPKYRNLSSSENIEKDVRDWYSDIENIINS